MTQNDPIPENDPANPQEGSDAPEVIDGAEEAEGVAETAAEAEAPAADSSAEIEALKAEVQKYKDEFLRAHAEMENVRRRAEQEVSKARKFAVQDFAKDLLSVADNLGRALSAVPEEARETDDAVKNLMLGVEMTEKELLTVFERYKVAKVDALGAPFDPNVHQAVMEMDNPDHPTGTVVQVMQEGYVLNERLLRPAMVAVSKGGPKREAEGGGDQTPIDQEV